MDPVLAILLLGAGTLLYLWAERDRLLPVVQSHLVRGRAALTRSLPTPATNQAVAAVRSLLSDGRRWLLVGAPGTGKSTAARQLVRSYRAAAAEVVIVDPDGAAWPAGARVVGAADDYPAIAQELEQLAKLARVRRQAFQQGRRDFDPLLLLIDEAPIVLRQTPGALEIVSDLARRGRKLAISVILLATDTQAKTLGIEGQTRLLDAFVRLDCRMTPSGVELLEDGAARVLFPLDYGANDLVLPTIEEQPATTPDADGLLGVALGTGTGIVESQNQPLLPHSAGTGTQAADLVPTDTDAVPGTFDAEVIKALASAGWSANKIVLKMGGRRNDALARVRQALGGGLNG